MGEPGTCDAGVDPVASLSLGSPTTIGYMDASTERIPVSTLRTRAADDKFGRIIVTSIAAFFLAIGWGIGRFFLVLGWLLGRAWLTLAFCGEAVLYGFQLGAKVPAKPLDLPDTRR